ncbi:hypothetical protein BROUX41_006269 [Berkeleyomyces rouxiae]|uniref:uncharacterized protein n=1 Tax=Berkeleyomyces rouxiae TaxID=2035830 RepID=UPI003B7FCA4C
MGKKNSRKHRRNFTSGTNTPSRVYHKHYSLPHFDFGDVATRDEYQPTHWQPLSGISLWKRPVKFVSAGISRPLENLDQLHKKQTNTQAQPAKELIDPTDALVEEDPVPVALGFPAFPTEIPRPVSPALSDTSSVEVIVFRGRKAATQAPKPQLPVVKVGVESRDSAVLLEDVKPDTRPLSAERKQTNTDALDLDEIRREVQEIIDNSKEEFTTAMVKPSHRRAARREARHRKKNQKRRSTGSFGSLTNPISGFNFNEDSADESLDSDLIVEDYRRNLAENGFDLEPTVWARRDLGGEEGDIVISPSEENSKTDSDDSDDIGEAEETFTSKIPEDKVEVENTLHGEIIAQEVQITTNVDPFSFELDNADFGSDSSSSEEDGDDENEDDEAFDQISANEENEDDEDEDGDEEDDEIDLTYDDDDDDEDGDIISIFPSLVRKKKIGKGSLPFFDPDLDPYIQDLLNKKINNNRMKKAARKKKRELLRAQGLLGKSASPGDLFSKYPSGMQFHEISNELQGFLSSDHEQLTFPPMAPAFRKGLHEIAHKLILVSKSTGKGNLRQTTFYKRANTTTSQSRFRHVMMEMGRRHFKVKTASLAGTIRSSKSVNEARYQDGEIVGALLPELGNDNRGHNLLKKMGWSRGTALGTVENKGILEPVMQKMKSSRAGLA